MRTTPVDVIMFTDPAARPRREVPIPSKELGGMLVEFLRSPNVPHFVRRRACMIARLVLTSDTASSERTVARLLGVVDDLEGLPRANEMSTAEKIGVLERSLEMSRVLAENGLTIEEVARIESTFAEGADALPEDLVRARRVKQWLDPSLDEAGEDKRGSVDQCADDLLWLLRESQMQSQRNLVEKTFAWAFSCMPNVVGVVGDRARLLTAALRARGIGR